MQRAGASRSWPVLGTGLVILVGVAAAARWLTRSPVSSTALAAGTGRAVADGVRLVFVALLLVGTVSLILSLVGGGLAGPDPLGGGRRRRFGVRRTLALVIGLAVAVCIFWFWHAGRELPHGRPAAVASPAAKGAVAASGARWGGDWPVVLGALVVAGSVAGAWIYARGRRGPSRPAAAVDPVEPEELAVPDGDLDPAAEPDPRRAVVIAYHRLLTQLARAGSGRWRSEAPLEHLDRVLAGRPGAMAPARSLAAAFERAEYSAHRITADDRDQALAWWRAVAAEVDATVPRP